MPVAKRVSKAADLRTEVAELLGVDASRVFVYAFGMEEHGGKLVAANAKSRPSIWVWTEQLPVEDMRRIHSLKNETVALMRKHRVRISLTDKHPDEAVAREHKRRRMRHTAWRNRNVSRTQKKRPGKAPQKAVHKEMENLANSVLAIRTALEGNPVPDDPISAVFADKKALDLLDAIAKTIKRAKDA